MADSTKIRSGLATLMQDHLSSKCVDLLLNTMPLIYFLLAKDGNKKEVYGLGRFATGALFSGLPISKPRREQVMNSDKYMPVIKTSNPAASDGKVATMYDTMPTRGSWTTATPASRFKRPFFKWVERIDPILVPKKEIRRTKKAAPNEKAANVAVGDLFKSEVDSVLSTHIQWWNEEFWGTNSHAGAPTDVDADVWDGGYSIENVAKTNNVYGGLDRSLAGNSFFRGNYDTTARPAVLSDLVNQANFTYGLQKKGQGLGLMLVGADLFPQFADEARAKGGIVYYDGLPEMGEWGFKRPIVRFNNTYVVYDPECPSVTNGAASNHIAGLNLDTWTVILNSDANFTVDEPFDLSKTDGGKDAIKSQIRTEMIVACEAPSMNVYWTDVG